MIKAALYCEVVGEGCKNPAGRETAKGWKFNDRDPDTRATCEACGAVVCTTCSRMQLTPRDGMQRYCLPCLGARTPVPA